MLTCLCSHRDKGVLVAWRASGEAGQWLVRLRRVEERPKSVKIVQYASLILLTAQTVVVGTWGSQIWIFLYSNNPMAYLPLKLLYFVLLKKEHLRRFKVLPTSPQSLASPWLSPSSPSSLSTKANKVTLNTSKLLFASSSKAVRGQGQAETSKHAKSKQFFSLQPVSFHQCSSLNSRICYYLTKQSFPGPSRSRWDSKNPFTNAMIKARCLDPKCL